MTAPHPGPSDVSVGQLVSQVSEQMTTLVRSEIALAQAELKLKGKKAGVGIGLFGGAGAIAFYGLGVLIAAAVLGLATALTPWLASLIVGAALLLIAGVSAFVGKGQVAQATPPAPTQAVAGIHEDIATVKESVHR